MCHFPIGILGQVWYLIVAIPDLYTLTYISFEKMVGQIYPTKLWRNKAIPSDTEAPFLNLDLAVTNDIVSSKIYGKQDDFNFQILNLPFLDGDIPRPLFYGVFISQFIHFVRLCSYIDEFTTINLFLNAKLLKQRYH